MRNSTCTLSRTVKKWKPRKPASTESCPNAPPPHSGQRAGMSGSPSNVHAGILTPGGWVRRQGLEQVVRADPHEWDKRPHTGDPAELPRLPAREDVDYRPGRPPQNETVPPRPQTPSLPAWDKPAPPERPGLRTAV